MDSARKYGSLIIFCTRLFLHICQADTLPNLLHCVMNIVMTHLDLTILVIDENAIRASIIEEGLREA
ncbi:hypothetical protein ACCS96_48560, partial [Rhizobium ruizarguesonis]